MSDLVVVAGGLTRWTLNPPARPRGPAGDDIWVNLFSSAFNGVEWVDHTNGPVIDMVFDGTPIAIETKQGGSSQVRVRMPVGEFDKLMRRLGNAVIPGLELEAQQLREKIEVLEARIHELELGPDDDYFDDYVYHGVHDD